MDKATYVRRLMLGRAYLPGLMDICLFMWHAEVPIEDALRYLDTALMKFNASVGRFKRKH